MEAQQVVVRDYAGRARVLFALFTRNDSVFVTSENNLKLIRAGISNVPPVGFPRTDIFQFHGSVPPTNPAWKSMVPWKEE